MVCDEEDGCCSKLSKLSCLSCLKSNTKNAPALKRKDHDYEVEEKYKVANYKKCMVTSNMNYSFLANKAIRSMFDPRYISQSLVGKTWKILLVFVVFWIGFQVLMQSQLLCQGLPVDTGKTGKTPTKPNTKAGAAIGQLCTPQQKKHLDIIFDNFRAHDQLSIVYLVFIVGFYVKQLVARWWEQVKSLPEVDSIVQHLSGLVFDKTGGPMGTSDATLVLAKTVTRYALLSWTLCMSSISRPLYEAFEEKKSLIDKGLITEEEFKELQVGTSKDGWKDEWMIPICWAICDANKASNKTKLIPKDHKNLVAALNRYQQQLHHLKRIHKNPLPLIYKQAVTVCMWAWLVLGVLASQGTHKETIWTGLFLNFPVYQAIKIVLLFGWLRVSEMIRNPFGKDIHFDINVVEKLDVEIWKASVAIRNIDQVST